MSRNTIQKALVLAAVRRLRNHATADEVYQDVRKGHPSISKGTVYRNLSDLDKEGEIRKRPFLGSIDRYDHIATDHYHAICDKCGRVFDVDMDYPQGLEGSVRDGHGFRFTGHDIVFRGVCPECQEREQQ
ncbi:MAG: transcriptional repressor [Coriobacteriaceae bacterium]|nr:transcriptional repressor [Coriobacteriaceae bacterium]